MKPNITILINHYERLAQTLALLGFAIAQPNLHSFMTYIWREFNADTEYHKTGFGGGALSSPGRSPPQPKLNVSRDAVWGRTLLIKPGDPLPKTGWGGGAQGEGGP